MTAVPKLTRPLSELVAELRDALRDYGPEQVQPLHDRALVWIIEEPDLMPAKHGLVVYRSTASNQRRARSWRGMVLSVGPGRPGVSPPVKPGDIVVCDGETGYPMGDPLGGTDIRVVRTTDLLAVIGS